jgi:hypothetical protein
MALKLSGKDERLTPRDFLTLARTIELPVARAEDAMATVASATRKAADTLSLPKIARDREGATSAEGRVKARAGLQPENGRPLPGSRWTDDHSCRSGDQSRIRRELPVSRWSCPSQ